MISQNTITLQGNLARDPQPLNSSGKARTRLVIAVNYGHGENQKVDYIDVTVFGTTAQNAATYLKKGAGVLVEGHLSQTSTTPETARTRSTSSRSSATASDSAQRPTPSTATAHSSPSPPNTKGRGSGPAHTHRVESRGAIRRPFFVAPREQLDRFARPACVTAHSRK